MNRKESYKRIKENKNDSYEDKIIKRDIYKAMRNKDHQNSYEFMKSPYGRLVRILCFIILILIFIIIKLL